MTTKHDDIILLAHGSGGEKTGKLINDLILTKFGNPILNQLDDAAMLNLSSPDIVVSTDSYVVTPLFFPGGNIGTLAACGTINDITMQGAQPLYLSLALIIEEGFPLAQLDMILNSIAEILKSTNVQIISGDTKVIEKGSGHGIFINTTGIGTSLRNVHVANAKPGDCLILTGTMGDHGISIMSQREGLKLDSTLKSDAAPLWSLISSLYEAHIELHVLRDPTRGGVAAAVNDIATRSNCGIRLYEKQLPIKKEVLGACSLLGLDPLTIANEGNALIVCPEESAAKTLDILRQHPLGKNAAMIGKVVDQHPKQVILETYLGGHRIVDMPRGEILPRIC